MSLKSSRVSEAVVPPIVEKKPPPVEMLTVWKCPKCGIVNKLGENNACINAEQNLCDFNVEDESYEPEFGESTEKEIIQSRKEWKEQHEAKKKKEQEENVPKSDEWDCDHCKHRNKMDMSHKRSAICKKCSKKNEVVLYMIECSMNPGIAK